MVDFRLFYRVYLWPAAARQLNKMIIDWLRDRSAAINTSGIISCQNLGLSDKTSRYYEPCSWDTINMALEGDPVYYNDVFIDFGSGKGRALFLAASNYPFQKVIGVEISEELNKIARQNIQNNLNKLLCTSIEIVTTDISEYTIPDNVTIVYLYDPIRGEVFFNLIRRLRISFDKNPRRMRIIYLHPALHDCLIENGFRMLRQLKNMIVYEEPLQSPVSIIV
jgi:SAM-dependent methyltransferase